MANSPFPTSQYTSAQFVESAGAVLFRVSTREIYLLYLSEHNEYVLPKGRRNCGESTRETAVREVAEEIGYLCRLMPVKMFTRAPPAIETEQFKDVPRKASDLIEPYTLQIRQQGENDVKVIWWYIAIIDEDRSHEEERLGEQKFRVDFYGYDESLEKLTFQTDQDIVRNAIKIFQETCV